jgi:hypothetical protein
MQWPIPPFPTKIVTGSAVTLTSAAATNSKGAWSTLLSGLSAPAAWVCVGTPHNLFAGFHGFLLDLAVGESGSETIVAPNLMIGYRGWRGTAFPLHIPAGATLRGRVSCQSSSQTTTVQIGAYLAEPDSGLSVPGRITPYGPTAFSTGGVDVTPSGTANVKGSWAQLTASTTSPIHALMVLTQGTTNNQSVIDYRIDIGVGGSGSETVIIPDHSVMIDSAELAWPYTPEFYPLSLSIPAGVRLAARCSSKSNTLTTPIGVGLYGFTF